MVSKNIIFIPGLGDRGWLYQFIITIYKALGYKPQVYVFGWNNTTTSLKQTQKDFTDYINHNFKDEKPYIIGISAGGTAALWALSKDLTPACITIASPFTFIVKANESNKLPALIEQNKPFLNKEPLNLLSIFGKYDQIVPAKTSQHPNIFKLQTIVCFHSLVISSTLIFKAKAMLKFLHKY